MPPPATKTLFFPQLSPPTQYYTLHPLPSEGSQALPYFSALNTSTVENTLQCDAPYFAPPRLVPPIPPPPHDPTPSRSSPLTSPFFNNPKRIPPTPYLHDSPSPPHHANPPPNKTFPTKHKASPTLTCHSTNFPPVSPHSKYPTLHHQLFWSPPFPFCPPPFPPPLPHRHILQDESTASPRPRKCNSAD